MAASEGIKFARWKAEDEAVRYGRESAECLWTTCEIGTNERLKIPAGRRAGAWGCYIFLLPGAAQPQPPIQDLLKETVRCQVA